MPLSYLTLLHCLVNGQWAQWGTWGSCDKYCGGGVQTKIRLCTNPKPRFGGKSCEGDGQMTKACNTHACPGKCFDQFLTENLFIGAEFGLLFLQTNNLVGSLTQVDGSSQTSSEVTTLIPKSNVQQLSLNGLGCIRIGWVF